MSIAVTVILALLIGGVLGFLIGWIRFKQSGLDKQLEQELAETKAQFTNYQNQVASHISHTADLMGKIQETYEMVQEHVYNGAQRLNLDQNRQSLLQPNTHYVNYQTLYNQGDEGITTIEGTAVEAPKDYA